MKVKLSPLLNPNLTWHKIMKDDYNDIYFVLIIGIASFFIILVTGIYIETL